MNANAKTYGGASMARHVLLLLVVLATLFVTAGVAVAAEPPTANDGEISEITRTSMKVCGTVNPHGQETVYFFHYGYFAEGKEQEYVTPSASAGEGETPVEVCTTLTGLPVHTSIVVRIGATNASGTTEDSGSLKSTAVAIEGLETDATTGVTAHSGVVHGAFEPNGYDTHYYFHCSAGQVAPTAPPPGLDAGAASEKVGVEAEVSGVAGNSEVTCFLTASNSFGSERAEPVKFTTEKAAPEIVGTPVTTNVTASSAVAEAGIVTQNEQTTYWVEYVEAAKYQPEASNPYAAGTKGMVVTAWARNAVGSPADAPLENLSPQTTYHYRLVVKNGTGEVDSGDMTVTTAGLEPPQAGTGEASDISSTGATISGTVNAEGTPTSYEFQVGTDTSYGGARIFGNGGEGEGTETVQTALAYLVPGVTYHYRLVATSKNGVAYGADRTFTTPDISSPIAQPATSPLLTFAATPFPPDEKATIVKKKIKKKIKPKRRHRGAKKTRKGKRKKK